MTSESLLRRKLLRKTRNASIIEAFIEEFEAIFLSEKPRWEEVKAIFDWLKEEAKCATYFADINTLNKCRRLTESNFSKLEYIKKRIWKESKEVNRELMKRFEKLRTTRKNTERKLSIFEANREEEKVLPPE